MPEIVTSEPAHPALTESQRLFRRVLSSWASDLLVLRREGLDRPGPRLGIWSIPAAGDAPRNAA